MQFNILQISYFFLKKLEGACFEGDIKTKLKSPEFFPRVLFIWLVFLPDEN